MIRRRVGANFIEGLAYSLHDFMGLFFSPDSRPQIQHELQRVFDSAVREWIKTDADGAEPLLQDVLRAIGDDQVRFEFDDLFDVGIEQAADSRLLAELGWN